MKKILLLSDTHSCIDEKIIKYVKLADEVWHAGDIGDLKVSDALKRTYEYHIHTQKNAFDSDDSYYSKNNLNINLMNKACEILKNHINFECFSKVHTDVNTFNCKIENAIWTKNKTKIIFTISADRFLRNMVRAIVGTMINIGLEKVSLQQFIEIIESKDRKQAGFSVPAHGLYLTKVEYDFIENE